MEEVLTGLKPALRKKSFLDSENKIQIRNASRKDLERIFEISDAEFGKNYLNETIEAQIDSQHAFVRVAETQTEGIIGFSYAYISNLEDLAENFGDFPLPESLKNSQKTANMKAIAIDANHKGKGTGSALMNDALSRLKKMDVDVAYGTVWKSKSRINIAGIMNFFAYTLHGEIEKYWTADSIKKGYSCPECGNPCQCSALIYTKVL